MKLVHLQKLKKAKKGKQYISRGRRMVFKINTKSLMRATLEF